MSRYKSLNAKALTVDAPRTLMALDFVSTEVLHWRRVVSNLY